MSTTHVPNETIKQEHTETETSDTEQSLNRRHFERFVLPPMYSPVCVQRSHEGAIERLNGHAYDISEAGVRFELDDALQHGERVTVAVDLPGEDRSLTFNGDVVWVNDDMDDPGPRRMGLRLLGYHGPDDQRRLLSYLGSGRLPRAA